MAQERGQKYLAGITSEPIPFFSVAKQNSKRFLLLFSNPNEFRGVYHVLSKRHKAPFHPQHSWMPHITPCFCCVLSQFETLQTALIYTVKSSLVEVHFYAFHYEV